VATDILEAGGTIPGKASESKLDAINIIGDNHRIESILNDLHKSLSKKGFTNISLIEFSHHFKDYQGDRKLIQWFGTEAQITSLFQNLVSKGVIDRSYEYRIPSTIPIHFINKKEQEFKDRQLRVSLSRVRSGDVDHLVGDIVEIVESLTEIN